MAQASNSLVSGMDHIDELRGAVVPAPRGVHVVNLDVVVTRGTRDESCHRVHAAVVDAAGHLLHAARDPQRFAWWRSCAKPFQVVPLLEDGGFDALGWGDDELALACASHGGEPEHVAIAQAMLTSVGLEEGDLACGAHEPLSSRGARILRETGNRATRLHNNCSGKHAAMIARAHTKGWPTTGYERDEHPVQLAIRDRLVDWTGLSIDALDIAIDGCGANVFGLPLTNMALSYARLAAAARHSGSVAARIVHAMTNAPFLVGGTDRFDTVLMEACRGNVCCKIGAEGVHTLAILDQGIGIAVKVEDGAPRAQYPAVLALLDRLGALDSRSADSLREFGPRGIRNTRGEVVGELRLVDEQQIGTIA